MFWRRLLLISVIGLVVGLTPALAPCAQAAQLKIPLPRRSQTTPVQQLNRDGVEAIRKQQFEKAKSLFYKAYLFDPDDPFTLNNLGYISELEGEVERAQRFYALAAEHATDADVDRASSSRMEGKPLTEVVSNIGDLPMQVNRANVESVRLLAQGRASEADSLLKQTLASDPKNPFTLNNMGVTREMEGDLEDAIKYYSAAAATHSAEPVIVTLGGQWRGKPVSEMAADSARRVQQRLHGNESAEARAVRLNLRGVAAVNRNDWTDARQFFQQAYELNPDNPFSLNNFGFVSEMDGDLETAQMFYEKARESGSGNLKVGLATRRAAEGKKLLEVAADNNQKMDASITAKREAKGRETGPIELKRRDGTLVTDTETSSDQSSSDQSRSGQSPSPVTPTLGPPVPPIPQLNPETPTAPPSLEPEPQSPPQ